MEWSEQSDKISAALLAAQQELGPVRKDGRNPHFKSTFATLNAVWETCAPVLHAHDLFVVQAPALASASVDTLVTEIRHKSGQFARGILRLNPVKDDPQGLGSAITYARRYSLCAMLGLMQSDDDGNEASRHTQRQKPTPKSSPAPKIDENYPVIIDKAGSRKPMKECDEDGLLYAIGNMRTARQKARLTETKAAIEAALTIAEEIAEHKGWSLPPF